MLYFKDEVPVAIAALFDALNPLELDRLSSVWENQLIHNWFKPFHMLFHIVDGAITCGT